MASELIVLQNQNTLAKKSSNDSLHSMKKVLFKLGYHKNKKQKDYDAFIELDSMIDNDEEVSLRNLRNLDNFNENDSDV